MKKLLLDARLAVCASFVRPGNPMADVGTDHGYLPVHLLLEGTIPFAVATDIRPGPLSRAQENAARYGVEKKMSCRLCDGLSAIAPGEVRDIVIAGMGGEMILKILAAAPWVLEPGMRLILQPMTMAPELRRGLSELGLDIHRETAVCAAGRVYSVLCVQKAAVPQVHDDVWAYMGALQPGLPETRAYAEKTIASLGSREGGLRHENRTEDADALQALQEKIRERYI